MRLIHTADVHLDMRFEDAGMPPVQAEARRLSLRHVLQSILARAAAWPADAVLIAGDLFDLAHVEAETVELLHVEFARLSPIAVFIAPGNSDPFLAHSPYASMAWPDNVIIFDLPQWQAYEVPHAPITVHGFGFNSAKMQDGPFGQLQIPRDGRAHVAVAHGSEMSCLPPGKKPLAPFSAALAASGRLAYLALGHFHQGIAIEAPFGTRMRYAGSPEPLGFNEAGQHSYIEIEGSAEDFQIRAVPSGRTAYTSYALDCSAMACGDDVVEALLALSREAKPSQATRVVLTGKAGELWQDELKTIYADASPAFDYLDLVDQLEPEQDYAYYANGETSFADFVRELNEEIRLCADPARRRMLARARQLGAAAYRGHRLVVRGLDED